MRERVSSMTQDQINSYIRTICTILSTLSGAGVALTAGQISTLESGLMGISSLVFLGISLYGSWKAHSVAGITSAADRTMSPDEKVIMAATAAPGTTIIASPALAAATPAQPNIVSSTEFDATKKAT